MAWEQLREDYVDAVWSGSKRYIETDNGDGTISIHDVTVYSNKEESFFGAKDANRMNQALNIIMAMVENGTDLYTAFLEYFSLQKELFDSKGDEIIKDLETNYRDEITEFETVQEQVFGEWFDSIKDQLGEDAAGNLQNLIDDLNERSKNADNLKKGTVSAERLPTVPVAKGGTGKTSVTEGNFLIGNGTADMQEATPAEALKAINTAPGNAARSMLCYANLEGTGIATSSMTTEEFVIAMPVNMTISFTHRTPDAIHLTDAPADYGIVVLTKGTVAAYVVGEFMDNSGKYYIYSRTNGWEQINAEVEEIGVSSGSGTRSTTYTTADAFDCTYTKYGRIAIVSFAATMSSAAGNTWADYEVATGVPKALSQSRGIVLLGSGNTATCAVTTSGAIRIVSRETSVAGKIVIGSVAYVTAS